MSFGGGFGSTTPAAGSAFNFSNTTPGAATPIKPVGFGAPATQQTPGFGVNTSFGTPGATGFGATATPGFGAAAPTGFGAAAPTGFGATATPSFGAAASSGFGGTGTQTTTSTFSTPSTGFGFGGTSGGFGTTPASTASTFGLGSTAPASGTNFGGFGGFGTTAATTTTPSLLGGFGTNTQQQASGFGTGGFGTNPQQQTSAFGTSGFGTNPQQTSAFGTNLQQQTSAFGTNPQQQNSAFGSGAYGGFGFFGPKPAATSATGFGNFGTGGNTFSNFGSTLTQPQQQQLQQVRPNNNAVSEALYNAVFNCQLFGDERDNTIARWNLIQALWGTGKAFYSLNAPPIELNQENPLCRFKAIGYSRMPDSDNNDGLIVLCFSKKEQEMKDGKHQVINSLNQILGNRPNLTITIDNIKSVGESKTQFIIFITEKGVTGSIRKIPANELFNFFTQPMQKQQLTQLGVENLFPQVKLDPAQLKEYMDNPPCFIDPRLWKQAQLDNPDPEHYIPVPMIGSQQVKQRLKCQEEETSRHRAFLDLVADNIQNLQRQHTAAQAKLKENRRTLMELQHRVLQILVRQEITRKIGFSLQPEEEALTHKFETMHSQISAPTQFKGRISEMLSQLRMRRHTDSQNQDRYTMDPMAQDDIKTYLNMEQHGMAQLVETVNSDLESLRIIKDGMSELVSNHNNNV